MEYSAESIILNKYPKLEQISDEKWKQVWNILLQEPISKVINLSDISQHLSHGNFNVQIKFIKEKYLKIYTTFNRDVNPYHHDHTIFSIYRMFEEIENLLGNIDTIQGHKIEDRWSPYRKK